MAAHYLQNNQSPIQTPTSNFLQLTCTHFLNHHAKRAAIQSTGSNWPLFNVNYKKDPASWSYVVCFYKCKRHLPTVLLVILVSSPSPSVISWYTTNVLLLHRATWSLVTATPFTCRSVLSSRVWCVPLSSFISTSTTSWLGDTCTAETWTRDAWFYFPKPQISLLISLLFKYFHNKRCISFIFNFLNCTKL